MAVRGYSVWIYSSHSLRSLSESERPSMIIVDQAQCCAKGDASNFMKRLHEESQATKIPLIVVGTFATIALLQSWQPIPTDSIHQLPPFSQDETEEFFKQASVEYGFAFEAGVAEAIHSMGGDDAGFLGMIGNYLVSKGWSNKPFSIADYFRAFHEDLRKLLLDSRKDALNEILADKALVDRLCFASRLTKEGHK